MERNEFSDQCPAAGKVPERLSAAWAFNDTRTPVHALFENLKDGATVDDL
jgi:uncharacterized protein (DUF433 family)